MIASPSLKRNSLAETGHCLEREDLDALLRHLVSERWQRLQPEYDDPLNMLMNRGARQWTAGWAPRGGTALYLLVWEADSFNERAWWRFYENGTLIYEEMDGASKARTDLFNKLLESEQLPFVTYRQWLDPILQYSQVGESDETAINALLDTLLARPEVFNALKQPLFQALEHDLGNEDWPLLELLKIHRLAHKTPLIRLFCQLVRQGFIRTVQDNARLDRALMLLQQDYDHFSTRVAPIFRSLYAQTYQEFRQLITAGTWRTSLRLKIPRA